MNIPIRSLGLAALLSLLLASCSGWNGFSDTKAIEQWDVFELSVLGPIEGNPFVEVEMDVRFSKRGRVYNVKGFYDGNGNYRARFMPDSPGTWRYSTSSEAIALNGWEGTFECVPPSGNNKGPVSMDVTNGSFKYADGSSFMPLTTTSLGWTHESDTTESNTLQALSDSPFNRVRMSLFPVDHPLVEGEPIFYPFARTGSGGHDFSRFDPAFFRHFEQRIGDLRDRGIEADIVLFQPDDKWGYANLPQEVDERLLDYIAARLSSFRNVWWTVGNEVERMTAGSDAKTIPGEGKTMDQWDAYFQRLVAADPYDHLRTINGSSDAYDFNKPWVTHASVTGTDFDGAAVLRARFGKPIFYDKAGYEGDAEVEGGGLESAAMLDRFWSGLIEGVFVGHGEAYNANTAWSFEGGNLRGQSHYRLGYLMDQVQSIPDLTGLESSRSEEGVRSLKGPNGFTLVYSSQPGFFKVPVSTNGPMKLDIVDPWKMEETAFGTIRAEEGKVRLFSGTSGTVFKMTPYESDESPRPVTQISSVAKTAQVPALIRFSASEHASYLWDFGDGSTSTERNPEHIYTKPGEYEATLTISDAEGRTGQSVVPILLDGNMSTALVRSGSPGEETHALAFNGDIRVTDLGAYDFGTVAPWKWITMGEDRLHEVEGLQSFTVTGWVHPDKEVGRGGHRVLSNLSRTMSGFDLSYLRNGRLQMGIDEWSDTSEAESSIGTIPMNEWTFFAVTYDGTKDLENLAFYFGDADTPVAVDRLYDYDRGPLEKGAANMTIGNYDETLHAYGDDRQFLGKLLDIRVYGSRIGDGGALSSDFLEEVRAETAPGK